MHIGGTYPARREKIRCFCSLHRLWDVALLYKVTPGLFRLYYYNKISIFGLPEQRRGLQSV